MKSYSFCTDGRLRITWCDENTLELLAESPPCKPAGRKYHDLLPPILSEGRDAVERALKEKRVKVLKEYCLRFHDRQFMADIVIEPGKKAGAKDKARHTPNGSAAKVTIFPRYSCNLAKRLENSQRLIDIGKIASILAHGVRNPLNAIKGAVVYLREKYSGEPTLLEFTKLMEEEISRLDGFISKFLSTSISDSEGEVDVNLLIKKTEVFISLQAHALNIKCSFTYGVDIPPVVTSSFQLGQAVLNVINNAIEAMRSGGSLCVVTRYEKKEGRGFVVIGVSDTGPGFAGGFSGQFRALEHNGKGFGLFITNEILQCHGGHLEIRSQRNVGTTVELFLPAKSR